MKKILSVLLALVLMLTSLSVFAFAYDEKNTFYPTVKVHGFMARDILSDKNDKDSDVIWPPSTDRILDAVKKAVPSLARFALTRNWKKLGDEITPLAKALFEPAFLDENGNARGNSGAYFVYPEPSEITRESEVRFCYDWRLDPIELAAELNSFIDYVLLSSGADKVNIQCHSFGGIITTTYIHLYGIGKLRSVVYNSTAVLGETYTGELMTGQLTLSKEALVKFLAYVFDYNDYETILNGVVDLLSAAGLLDFVCKFGNDLVRELGSQVLPEVIVPAFGGWLSVWAMTPDEDVADSMDYVFNEIYKNSDVDRTGLVNKINAYNMIRPHKVSLLNELKEKTNFYVISRYGYCSIPITPSWRVMSDGVVDSKYTSFGGTFAEFDKQLTNEQLAGKDPSMISPNKNADASTCMFPEQTWYIRNMKHANSDGNLDEFIHLLLSYDGQATVDTFEEFPRFLMFDSNADKVVPDTAEKAPDFLKRVATLIKELFAMFKKLAELIFGKIVRK